MASEEMSFENVDGQASTLSYCFLLVSVLMLFSPAVRADNRSFGVSE